MALNLPVPRPSHSPELLDQPGITPQDLAANFRDIKLINRWFGGVSLVEKSLRPLLPVKGNFEISLLDLASGVADVPLALARRWKPRFRLKITALDLNPEIVKLAEAEASREKASHFEAFTADVFKFDFDLKAGPPYDFVTCSLAFHHFPPELRVKLLQLMAKLARRGFVVNDLERSWFGFFGAYLLGLTLTRNRLTRHDAPLSVLRAFTVREFWELVTEANLSSEFEVTVVKRAFSRLAIVGRRIKQ